MFQLKADKVWVRVAEFLPEYRNLIMVAVLGTLLMLPYQVALPPALATTMNELSLAARLAEAPEIRVPETTLVPVGWTTWVVVCWN